MVSRTAIVAASLIGLQACTTTFHLSDGRVIEGKVRCVNEVAICLQGAEVPGVRRADIERIEYPGTTPGIVFSSLAGLGAVGFVSFVAARDTISSDRSEVVAIVGYSGLGLLLTAGLGAIISWGQYSKAVESVHEAPRGQSVKVEPVAFCADGDSYYGAGVSWSW